MLWFMLKMLFLSVWIEYKVVKNYNGILLFEFVFGINMKS